MTTHDYRKDERRWGHDYGIRHVYEGGMRIDMYGWGRNIQRDDYILMNVGTANQETRYQIHTITYMENPSDMWFARAHFAPRE